MSKSRLKNVIVNSYYGIIAYIIIIFAAFISQMVFVEILGVEYLGLNGLFFNIVSMLALTELGFGTAILHFLYEPIENKDYAKIIKLMSLYKRIYRKISICILILGTIITVFINSIANSNLEDNHVRIYFVLFFVNTALSYLWSYKRGILYADQRNRVISFVHMITKVLVILLQCIYIKKTSSYLGYLAIQIIGTILENYLLSKYVDNKYSFLKNNKKDI